MERNSHITLRPASSADLDVLAIMNKQLIEDEKHDNPMSVSELKQRMEGFIAGDYLALLGMEKDNIIGYALVNKNAKPLYLRQFFIRREERRKGHGRRLFYSLLEYLNTDTIDIEVLAWNETGKSFWESLQFGPRSIYMRYEGKQKGKAYGKL